MKRRVEKRAATPAVRSVPVRGTGASIDNAGRQRKALSKMSPCEVLTGKTVEQLDEFHAEQRQRVLKRFGVEA